MRGVVNSAPLKGEDNIPFYEYECSEHGRFTVRQPMFSEHKSNCLVCGEPTERRFSMPNTRFAEPITLLQELPGGRGYQVLGWKADSGISHKPGEPYKTAKEVAREEEDSINATSQKEKEKG